MRIVGVLPLKVLRFSFALSLSLHAELCGSGSFCVGLVDSSFLIYLDLTLPLQCNNVNGDRKK